MFQGILTSNVSVCASTLGLICTERIFLFAILYRLNVIGQWINTLLRHCAKIIIIIMIIIIIKEFL